MATDYRRPGVAVENKTAPMNGRQDVGLITGIIATADDGVTTENYDVIRSAASDDTDFVVNNLSDAAVTHKGYAYTKDVDFAITAGGEINWAANTPLTPPYLTDVQTTTGAATLGVGTYYYKVAAIKCMDETNRAAPSSWGVTLPSNEKSITLAVASAVRITWIAVPQAEGYHIYRGTTSGGETLLATVLGEVLTFTDIGVYTPSVTSPVTSSTALRKPSYSKAATAGTYVGQAITEATTAGAVIAYDAGSLDVALDSGTALQIRNVDFREITGSDTVKCGQVAEIFEYHLQNWSGTKSKFYGGDASLNLAAIKAVTAGRVKIYGDNNIVNGDVAMVTSATTIPNWLITDGDQWTATTGKFSHAAGVGTHVLEYRNWAPSASRDYVVSLTVNSLGAGNLLVDIGGAAQWTIAGPVASPTVYTHTFASTVSTAAFKITGINGITAEITGISVRTSFETASFSLVSANTLSDVASLLQTAVRAATGAGGAEIVTYNSTTGAFEFESGIAGRCSRLTVAAPSAGTDLTVSSLLYTTGPGYEIAGAASVATCTYSAVTRKYTVTSATTGAESKVVITQPAAGDDLWIANAMYFNGGTQAAGVDGSYTTYQVVATIAGGNYFNTEYVYTATDAADKYGANSDLAFYCEKYLQAPPAGNGGKIVAATGVPVMDRNTAQAAMTAQESVRMELSTIVTNDIDIIRDHYGHCAAMSTAAKSKWRVGIAVVNKNISTSALVALATELGSGYYGLIYDNISQDDNISPYIGALISSLPMVSDSIINRRIYTENALLSKPRLSAGTVDYLLANGIMVFDYNGDGVPCIIDDVMTAGSQFALAGAISDTMLRYRIQIALTPVTARVKMNRDGRLAAKNALVKELESQLGTLIDPEGGFTDPEVSASSSDRFKAVVRFSYTEIVTMKRIDVEYYIA